MKPTWLFVETWPDGSERRHVKPDGEARGFLEHLARTLPAEVRIRVVQLAGAIEAAA